MCARRASLIVGMKFTIDSCVLHVFKEFLAPELGEELVCQCEEGDPNGVYAVVVKTDVTKTVQIKHNNDFYSFSHISSSILS